MLLKNSIPPSSVSISLPHTWDHIRQMRGRVAEALKGADESLRAATVMVTSELLENAVKYGEEVPAAKNIKVSLVVDETSITVKVINGSTDATGVAALARRIDEIMSADDKSVLYFDRLEQLMSDPTESGKLGLYRIAFEGQFDIQLSYQHQVVAITATRKYL